MSGGWLVVKLLERLGVTTPIGMVFDLVNGMSLLNCLGARRRSGGVGSIEIRVDACFVHDVFNPVRHRVASCRTCLGRVFDVGQK